jgi:hypothetical protein
MAQAQELEASLGNTGRPYVKQAKLQKVRLGQVRLKLVRPQLGRRLQVGLGQVAVGAWVAAGAGDMSQQMAV